MEVKKSFVDLYGSAKFHLPHQFFFTSNYLRYQSMTSQLVYRLTLQTDTQAASTIHCVLSEYATGKKVSVLCSEDKYQGKVRPSVC